MLTSCSKDGKIGLRGAVGSNGQTGATGTIGVTGAIGAAGANGNGNVQAFTFNLADGGYGALTGSGFVSFTINAPKTLTADVIDHSTILVYLGAIPPLASSIKDVNEWMKLPYFDQNDFEYTYQLQPGKIVFQGKYKNAPTVPFVSPVLNFQFGKIFIIPN